MLVLVLSRAGKTVLGRLGRAQVPTTEPLFSACVILGSQASSS